MAYGEPFDPMLSAPPYVGPLPINYRMMEQEMNQPRMYQQPYVPNLFQQAAVFGANLMGYQVEPMAQWRPGQSAYALSYQQRVTSPFFETMQQRLNYRMGQMLATTAGQMLDAMNKRPAGQTDAQFYGPMLAVGTSAAGQLGAGLLQQTAPVQAVMGGDIREMWRNMFANRNFLAFQPGQIINPENRPQQLAAARYTTMLMEDLSRRVYTDGNGRSSIVPNVSVTGGRAVEELGGMANLLATMDPASRGMSRSAAAIMMRAAGESRGLNPQEMKRVAEDVKKFNDRAVDMLKAFAAVGDAIGESDLVTTIDMVNRTLQGNAFKMDARHIQAMASELSAGEQIYGVSAMKQLGMQKTIGDSFAGAIGAINPITGGVDSPTVQYMNRALTKYALTMSAQTGMSPEQATQYMQHYAVTSGSSTAGRLNFMIEAAFRTQQISEQQYADWNNAVLTGDVRKQQSLIRRIGEQMGGRNLMQDINDPNRMRLVFQQLDALSPEQNALATQNIVHRLAQGPLQEQRVRAIEYGIQTAEDSYRTVARRAGVRSTMNRDEYGEATYAGYRKYLTELKATATGDRASELQRKIDLIEAKYAEDGITGVNRAMSSGVFDEERGDMERAARHERASRLGARVGRDAGIGGLAGAWMSKVRVLSTDRNVLNRLADAQKAMQVDPTSGIKMLSEIYGMLDPATQAALGGDPAQMAAEAARAFDPATLGKVNAEYERQLAAAKDPSTVRWDKVMQQMTGVSGTVASQAQLYHRANLDRQTAMYAERLNDPATQVKLQKLLDANRALPVDKQLSYEQIMMQAVGADKDGMPMSALQMRNLWMTAGQMGFTADELMNMPTDQSMAAYQMGMNIQQNTEASYAQANAHMKLSMLQRATKWATQDPKAANRIRIMDVLGIETGARVRFTDIANQMAGEDWGELGTPTLDQLRSSDTFKALQERYAKDPQRLDMLNKYRNLVIQGDAQTRINSMSKDQFEALSAKEQAALIEAAGGAAYAGSGGTVSDLLKTGKDSEVARLLGGQAPTAENLKMIEQTRAINEAISAARGPDMDTSKIDEIANSMAKQNVHRNVWGHIADFGKNIWGMFDGGQPDTVRERYASGVRDVLLDAARSGQPVDVGRMETLRRQMDEEGAARAAGGGRGGGEGPTRIVIESGNLTIDMGGKMVVGTINGEGSMR